MKSGIYKIINKTNGKFYIGQSVNIKQRWGEHKSPSHIKNGKNVLCRAFRKYGRDNFYIEIIEYCTHEMLNEKEIYYISTLKPDYNMNNGGRGNCGHSVSNEVRRHLSKCGKLQWERKTEAEKQYILQIIYKDQK